MNTFLNLRQEKVHLLNLTNSSFSVSNHFSTIIIYFSFYHLTKSRATFSSFIQNQINLTTSNFVATALRHHYHCKCLTVTHSYTTLTKADAEKQARKCHKIK